MKSFLVFTTLILSLSGNASVCPEGQRAVVVYNDCVSTAETMCATWYSRIDCVEESEKICTRDRNPWGHPSKCRCDQGEYWNQVLGQCRAKFLQSCTADINQWGYASSCTCDKGLAYDETIGLCSPDLDFPRP
ncbi:MAG: hypothetical protein DRQ88_10280 [Epsilonproteobacteria bacterium]|nr:MAG: hypothetical protein DRQ89_03010 [Campylobacterota bacterium]RLA64866.1 MAG: hypothetical protein DRQ88_10280 [Campylobacterota bacterium]